MARDTWGYVFYFALYEYVKNLKYPVRKDGTRDKPPLFFIMPFGALSGAFMWLMAYPFDVIKTEMQVDNLSKKRYGTSLAATSDIYSRYGINGFY